VISIQGPNFEKEVSIEDFKYLLNRTLNWINEVKFILDNESDEKYKKAILNKISFFSIPESFDKTILEKLNEEQLLGISLLKDFLVEEELINEEKIQNKIFNIAKEILQIPPKKMFEALYLVILGKKFGPRLGPFLILLDREWLLDRLSLQD
jgi:lysyl-tRNA synthetase class I